MDNIRYSDISVRQILSPLPSFLPIMMCHLTKVKKRLSLGRRRACSADGHEEEETEEGRKERSKDTGALPYLLCPDLWVEIFL